MDDGTIQIKLAEDPEHERWDEFVLDQQDASPYHLFAWKKAIEDAYGHKCNYLYAEENNEIAGILPLVQLRLTGLTNEMVGLPYCDVGGCLSRTKRVQDLLCDEGIRHGIQSKADRFQLRGNLQSTNHTQSILVPIDTDKVRMILDLPPTAEDLLKRFKSKLRSQVRKAEKNGIAFQWGGLNDIDKAYPVFSKNMHELGSPVHSKYFLKSVLEHYGNRAKLGMAEFQGKIIGMGIILLGGNSVCIPWASTLRDYNRLGPNMLLYWNFLKYAADNGFSFFDFGRSTEGEGTYKFKQQWGAKPIPLVWYELKNETVKKNHSKTKFDNRAAMAALWRRLPLTMANLIGPHVRKYISL